MYELTFRDQPLARLQSQPLTHYYAQSLEHFQGPLKRSGKDLQIKVQ